MTQEITKGEGKSLYDFMKEQGSDFDVYDRVVDIGTAAGITDDPTDACGVVCDHILKNTELVKHIETDVVGDFWKFVEDNYDTLARILTPELVNEPYCMDNEDREENITNAVCCIIEIIRGNAGNRMYDAYMGAFDLLPEDHVVYDFRVMDIDEYLAVKERDGQEVEE